MCPVDFVRLTLPVVLRVANVQLKARAAFAEKRLQDIKAELDKERDVAVAEALRRAKAEAEATVHRLQVQCL